jgi:hypothetical protein
MRSYLARSIFVVLGIILASPFPMALASSDLTFRWMEVLVSRVEPTYRELHLLNYRSGLTPTGFQVPGWVNLHQYKVGDHLLASVGINNTLIAYLRKTPPPTGDKQYEEALRRVLAEEGRTP